MRTDHRHAAPASHMRPLALGQQGTALPEDTSGSRFLDTGRLDDDRKQAIVDELVDRKIGDRASCSLFVRAMEYELATYREMEADAPEQVVHMPSPLAAAGQEGLLEAIGGTGRELSELIQSITEDLKSQLLANLESQDQMRRGYGERYLDQLQVEVIRLVSACDSAPMPSRAAQVSVATQSAAPPAAARHFIASLGHMYEECFERPPTAEENGSFASTLAVLNRAIGLQIPTDPESLKIVLSAA